MPAHPDERCLVARVVVDHPHAVDDVVAEHLPELGVGVAPVRSGRDQDDDVLEPDDRGQLLEERGNHDSARLWARAVADADRDRLTGVDDVAQGRACDRLPQGRRHGSAPIGGRREMVGGDHRRPAVREVDREPALAVGKLYLHTPSVRDGTAAVRSGFFRPPPLLRRHAGGYRRLKRIGSG